MKKIALSIGLVVAVAAGGVLYVKLGEMGGESGKDRAQTGGKNIANVASASDVPAPELAPVAAPHVMAGIAHKSTLFTRAQTATDLRVFVEAVKREAESGGAFYANEALLQCRLLRNTGLRPESVAALRQKLAMNPDEVSKQRLASLDWLDRRCSGFTDAELSGDEQSYLLSWGVEKDPLMALRRRAHKLDRSNATARQQLLAEMLATQDPLLLEGARGVSMEERAGDGAPVAYLDGVENGGLDIEGYIYAWDLAICRVAGSCNAQDAKLKAECAFAGECLDSVQARVLRAVGSREKFDRISSVADRLQQVIRNQDTKALLDPRRG